MSIEAPRRKPGSRSGISTGAHLLRLVVGAATLAALPGPASAADGAAFDGADVGVTYVDSALPPPMSVSAATASTPSSAGPTSTERGNPIYAALARGLDDYRSRWAGLPQLDIPRGPALRFGSTGPRVQQLRLRLGLASEGGFDATLEQALRAYQSAHGLPDDGIAGPRTLGSLNAGAAHYERLIELNLARARSLPADLGARFILVDAAEARLWMYEDGRPVDSMRVIVGRRDMATPALAGMIRHAMLNPYWNVPPDLVRERIAPNVLSQGLSYLAERRYELLSGWGDDAVPIDPASVDWRAVAAGRRELRVRQQAGGDNMMGEVKFEFPNDLGIYLHDTPDRHLFDSADRRQSSGCVRLEDARRLSFWLFGRDVFPLSRAPEQRLPLPAPVPIYITYFTAAPGETGIVFREDVYGRDRPALARIAAAGPTRSR
jgi:murein L,D-transpeptidase YcbB/YkuD